MLEAEPFFSAESADTVPGALAPAADATGDGAVGDAAAGGAVELDVPALATCADEANVGFAAIVVGA